MHITFTPLTLLSFFFTSTATTEIYTLSLHDALPICKDVPEGADKPQARELVSLRLSQKYYFDPTFGGALQPGSKVVFDPRSEEHTSELQSHHDLVCRLLLEKKKKKYKNEIQENIT